MELSNEFLFGSGGTGLLLAAMGFLCKSYMKRNDDRHTQCEAKIDDLLKKVNLMGMELARISTTLDILVYDKTGQKTS